MKLKKVQMFKGSKAQGLKIGRNVSTRSKASVGP
jgi:hypothetical protein